MKMAFAVVALGLTTTLTNAVNLYSLEQADLSEDFAQTETDIGLECTHEPETAEETMLAEAEVEAMGGQGVAPINVIDNSRGSSGTCGCGGGGGGGNNCFTGLPINGFGNLGMDAEFLNPILKQRLDLLER